MEELEAHLFYSSVTEISYFIETAENTKVMLMSLWVDDTNDMWE